MIINNQKLFIVLKSSYSTTMVEDTIYIKKYFDCKTQKSKYSKNWDLCGNIEYEVYSTHTVCVIIKLKEVLVGIFFLRSLILIFC